MHTATIGIQAVTKGDIGRVVFADDRARIIGDKFDVAIARLDLVFAQFEVRQVSLTMDLLKAIRGIDS